jgi:hypothetical protein
LKNSFFIYKIGDSCALALIWVGYSPFCRAWLSLSFKTISEIIISKSAALDV